MQLASLSDALLARHATLGRKDCVTIQNNVCEGGYGVLAYLSDRLSRKRAI